MIKLKQNIFPKIFQVINLKYRCPLYWSVYIFASTKENSSNIYLFIIKIYLGLFTKNKSFVKKQG